MVAVACLVVFCTQVIVFIMHCSENVCMKCHWWQDAQGLLLQMSSRGCTVDHELGMDEALPGWRLNSAKQPRNMMTVTARTTYLH